MLDAGEVSVLEPGLVIDARARAAYSPNDGAVDPVLATGRLLAAAEQLGATLRYPSKLLDVELAAGRLTSVVTSAGTIRADRLVLATGAAPEAPRRFADVDIPQRSTPGVIVLTEPLPRVLGRVVAAPGVHMHQRDDGRIVLGEQAGAPANEAHALRLAGRPTEFPSASLARQHADRVLADARRFLPAAAEARIEAVYIGWRPLPLDGHPVLGLSPARPDVYLAIMHSGVSLAPLAGELVAQELIEGSTLQRLAPYRPDRAFEDVRRY
jgi:glycine/D-amino acid oxidase-like deaminating enzyme